MRYTLVKSTHISRLLYEGHEDFSVLPTFGVLPALRACFEQVQEGLPGVNIDLSMVWIILSIFHECNVIVSDFGGFNFL